MEKINEILLMLNERVMLLEEELNNKDEFIKNSYRKFGRIFEQYAPFAKNFPAKDLSKFIFLGKPIDGIIFGDDKITFVEIKTGKSILSENQQKVKELVEQGKIEFKEVRYDGSL